MGNEIIPDRQDYVLIAHQDAVAMPGSGRPTLLWHAINGAHWTTGSLFSCNRTYYYGCQVMFLMSGGMHGRYRGSAWQATAGQAVVLDLREPHKYASDPGNPAEIVWVNIDPRGLGVVQQFAALTDEHGPVVRFNTRQIVQTHSARLFALMRRGAQQDTAWIHHHLGALMAALFSAAHGDPSLAGMPVAQRRHPGQPRVGIRPVIALIQEHYSRLLALDELAAAAGLSSSHFARVFRSVTGITPFDYIERYRIARAQEQLRAGSQLSVRSIGAAVGYPDPAYFSRVFRRITGTTPSRYRASQS